MNATIGDEIRYTVVVDRPLDWTLLPPDFGVHLGGFEVRDVRITPVRTREAGVVRTEYGFLLATYETGEFDIPALDFFLTDSAGRTNRLRADAVRVTITALTSTNDEPAGLKRPFDLKDTLLWLKILLPLLLLALAGFGIYRYLERRKRLPAFLVPSAPVLPPDAEAFQKLDAMEQAGLPKTAPEVKAYYTGAMNVLRVFLARSKGVVTMERTSEEILDDLDALGLPLDHLDGVRDLFAAGDLVKFAKRTPSRAEIAGLIPAVRRMVETLAPRPVSPPDPEKPDSAPGVTP